MLIFTVYNIFVFFHIKPFKNILFIERITHNTEYNPYFTGFLLSFLQIYHTFIVTNGYLRQYLSPC